MYMYFKALLNDLNLFIRLILQPKRSYNVTQGRLKTIVPDMPIVAKIEEVPILNEPMPEKKKYVPKSTGQSSSKPRTVRKTRKRKLTNFLHFKEFSKSGRKKTVTSTYTDSTQPVSDVKVEQVVSQKTKIKNLSQKLCQQSKDNQQGRMKAMNLKPAGNVAMRDGLTSTWMDSESMELSVPKKPRKKRCAKKQIKQEIIEKEKQPAAETVTMETSNTGQLSSVPVPNIIGAMLPTLSTLSQGQGQSTPNIGPIIIPLPITIAGVQQMAYMPLFADKDGVYRMPDGNVVDVQSSPAFGATAALINQFQAPTGTSTSTASNVEEKS